MNSEMHVNLFSDVLKDTRMIYHLC